LIFDLQTKQVRLESPYTDQELRDFKEMTVGHPPPATPQPAPEPQQPIEKVWLIYHGQKIKLGRWKNSTPDIMQGTFDRYLEFCADGKDPWLKKSGVAYRDYLLQNFAPETARLQVNRLRSFGKWAVDGDYSSINPFQGVEVERPKDKPV